MEFGLGSVQSVDVGFVESGQDAQVLVGCGGLKIRGFSPGPYRNGGVVVSQRRHVDGWRGCFQHSVIVVEQAGYSVDRRADVATSKLDDDFDSPLVGGGKVRDLGAPDL